MEDGVTGPLGLSVARPVVEVLRVGTGSVTTQNQGMEGPRVAKMTRKLETVMFSRVQVRKKVVYI